MLVVVVKEALNFTTCVCRRRLITPDCEDLDGLLRTKLRLACFQVLLPMLAFSRTFLEALFLLLRHSGIPWNRVL